MAGKPKIRREFRELAVELAELGIDQRQIADVIGCSQAMVSKILEEDWIRARPWRLDPDALARIRQVRNARLIRDSVTRTLGRPSSELEDLASTDVVELASSFPEEVRDAIARAEQKMGALEEVAA